MSILKGIVLTFSVFAIITLLELLILSLQYNQYTPLLYQTLPSLIPYIIAIVYFRFSNADVLLDKEVAAINQLSIILILFFLSLGEHIVDLPFFKWKNLSNEYFGTKYEIPSFSNTRFSIFRIYHGISALFIAPLFEELFFRYYILGGLLKKYNLIKAILISSSLFAIIHIANPRNLIPAFIFGILSSVVYFRTKKIIFSILLHFFSNGLWFLAASFPVEYNKVLDKIGLRAVFWCLYFVGVLIILICIKTLYSRLYIKQIKN